MKRLLASVLFAALALVSIAPASAQVYQGGGVLPETLCSYTSVVGYPTPCAPTVGDKPISAPALASGAATKILTGVTGASWRITYLAYSAYESATGGALELLYGTGTNCGTGTTVLHVISYVPATTLVAGQLGTAYGQNLIAPAGKDVCAEITAGTVTEASVAGTAALY